MKIDDSKKPDGEDEDWEKIIEVSLVAPETTPMSDPENDPPPPEGWDAWADNQAALLFDHGWDIYAPKDLRWQEGFDD